ncbi:MAG: heavy-metal-associated domain-containing protein [Bacteroidota bacterium]
MKYQFKTNINCGGCVAKIEAFLDGEENIKKWEVDTTHADKILSVESESWQEEQIIHLVESAGFKAEARKKGIFGKLFG